MRSCHSFLIPIIFLTSALVLPAQKEQRQPLTEAQVEKIQEIVKRQAKEQAAKANRANKSKAKANAPEEEAPPEKHPNDVILAELKSETSANFRRTWAEAPTKVQRRYLREVLNWEGGKPASKSD